MSFGHIVTCEVRRYEVRVRVHCGSGLIQRIVLLSDTSEIDLSFLSTL